MQKILGVEPIFFKVGLTENNNYLNKFEVIVMGHKLENLKNIAQVHRLFIERIVALGKASGYSARVINEAVIQANIESGFDVNELGNASGKSQPKGLYQYIDTTWEGQFLNYAKEQNKLLVSGKAESIDVIARATYDGDDPIKGLVST
ncbi:hypothetical protein [Undibacterium baiyunense]|uniref:Uncharacterized protein n=1 Tax=Undibacterium baiyunense TaxID=2828731 RepID=A0A941DDV3_9BURK|nr:hypothetical protein [Undibacterium baiyunense]MBR7746306.1 hypothetical protein [Undibacterium baiyunense]